MDSSRPVQYLFVLEIRFDGLDLDGKMRFCTDKVDFGQEFIGLQDGRNLRTHRSREFGQDADDFAAFFSFQFTDAVVGFHYFGRFDEHGLTRSRFVVYNPLDFSFQPRSHWNHQSSVTHGRCHILVHIPFGLCCTEDSMQASGDAAGGSRQFPTDTQQFRRRIVTDFTELVENAVDA